MKIKRDSRRKTRKQMMLAGTVGLTILVFVAGCSTSKRSRAVAKQQTIHEPNVGLVTEVTQVSSAGVETSVSWAGYTPEVMDKMHVTEVAYPTGNKKTSAILLNEVMPVEVLRGGEYIFEYHITNLTDLTHQDVVITNEDTHNLTVVSSLPAMKRGADGSNRWIIGDLAPRETKVVRVRATSETVGPASDCVSVSYTNTLCTVTTVVDPDLLLVKTAATDGTICDDFWFTYEVVNPGSGIAKNIHIRDEIPRGLRTVEGNKRVVEIDAGDLSPGERKSFTVKAHGVETGRHRSIAVATADGGLISESENIETLIYQPVLTIDADTSIRQYLGRNVDLTYTVKNTGDIAAQNTVVTALLPSEVAQVVGTSGNGTVAQNRCTWQLGALGVNESKTVSVRLKGTSVGTISTAVFAVAECATEVTDATSTSILGISAILLELVDIGDPVEVGNIVTYTIIVINQGSAPDTNIVIICEIPGEEEYISTTGPTRGRLRGRILTFAPLATLAVGGKAQWQIQVRAKEEEDVRFGVSMTSDQLKTAVIETEATTIY